MRDLRDSHVAARLLSTLSEHTHLGVTLDLAIDRRRSMSNGRVAAGGCEECTSEVDNIRRRLPIDHGLWQSHPNNDFWSGDRRTIVIGRVSAVQDFRVLLLCLIAVPRPRFSAVVDSLGACM